MRWVLILVKPSWQLALCNALLRNHSVKARHQILRAENLCKRLSDSRRRADLPRKVSLWQAIGCNKASEALWKAPSLSSQRVYRRHHGGHCVPEALQEAAACLILSQHSLQHSIPVLFHVTKEVPSWLCENSCSGHAYWWGLWCEDRKFSSGRRGRCGGGHHAGLHMWSCTRRSRTKSATLCSFVRIVTLPKRIIAQINTWILCRSGPRSNKREHRTGGRPSRS
mmetsp:Transcript_146739/g.269538  ORF Transcript_146739/g.269538 Transcript_146739/m.269538 type:complete len:224 (+) Transcript_146739:550-1221(+)